LKARLLVSVSALAVVSFYASGVWYAEPYARAVALSLEERPFVYRALMPWLARGLMGLGLSATAAIGLLVFAAAIGLVYAIRFLSETFKR
jgi:hypothetical protein